MTKKSKQEGDNNERWELWSIDQQNNHDYERKKKTMVINKKSPLEVQ